MFAQVEGSSKIEASLSFARGGMSGPAYTLG